MATRKRIGLIFKNNENWIGGTYYILNLIHALKTLPKKRQPTLVIYSSNTSDLEMIRKETSYTYLEKGSYTSWRLYRAFNKISRMFFSRNLFAGIQNNQLDAVFPNPPNTGPFINIDNPKKIYWIPDFQENYLPEFFHLEEIERRQNSQRNIALSDCKVIFSSNDTMRDFYRLYPNAKAKANVLNFAVTHPNYQHLNIEELKSKYNLPTDYFFSPNQFWVHKNHMAVIKTVEKLLTMGRIVNVVFTGKEYDFRDPDYTVRLKSYVEDKGLNDHVYFLGFIDRREQLKLMSHAAAVIQPSFFEGWSTVVEDAKAMNQFIIASDIPVHREQIRYNGMFFNPNSFDELANILRAIMDSPPKRSENAYFTNVQRFGRRFLEIIES